MGAETCCLKSQKNLPRITRITFSCNSWPGFWCVQAVAEKINRTSSRPGARACSRLRGEFLMLTIVEKVLLLQNIELFSLITSEQLSFLAAIAEEIEV